MLVHASGHEDRDHRRHEGEREDEGGGERDDDGQRHRLERLALDAGESQQRNVDERDDALPVDGRLDDLARRRSDRVEALVAAQHAAKCALALGKAPQAVLRDDHAAVDDQPEVERAQAHEVGADPELQHADGGDQHGDRNDERGDDRGAEVSEQQQEHEDDERGADHEVGGDGVDRGVDQLRPVQDGPRADARRQRPVDFGELGVGCGRDGAAVAADEHQRGAEHRLAAVDAAGAGPQVATDGDVRNFPDANGDVAMRRDHDIADLGKLFDPAGGAHHVALAEALDVIGAARRIIGFDRRNELRDRKTEAGELHRIGLDPVLLDVAADGVGAGDTRDALHLRADDPVLDGAQVDEPGEIVGEAFAFGRQIGAVALPSGRAVAPRRGRRIVVDRPPIDLAEPGRDRPHLHVDAGGQAAFGVGEAFGHLLAREINVGAVREYGGDLGKAVARERPRLLKPRRAGKRDLDRKRHLLLDFDRRQRRRECVDLNLHVGDVGDRIDRQRGDGKSAGDRSRQRDHEDVPATADRKRQNPFDHGPISPRLAPW